MYTTTIQCNINIISLCVQKHSFIAAMMLYTVFLQARPLVEDITSLPQWSDPIAFNFTTLPPPEITSTNLIATSLTVNEISGDFTVNVTVDMKWKQPLGAQGRDFELWIGGRIIGEYEQLKEGVISSSDFQFQVLFV